MTDHPVPKTWAEFPFEDFGRFLVQQHAMIYGSDDEKLLAFNWRYAICVIFEAPEPARQVLIMSDTARVCWNAYCDAVDSGASFDPPADFDLAAGFSEGEHHD